MARIEARIMIQLFIYKYCLSEEYRPPEILSPDKGGRIYIAEGSPVDINCTADGWPHPTFDWYVNGSDIEQTGFTSFSSVTGVLNITHFSWREEGDYRCIATNKFTHHSSGTIRVLSSMSPVLTLLQIYVERPVSSPQTVWVQEFDYAQLPCGPIQIAQANEIKYKWFDTGTNLKILDDDDRLFIDQNGTLHFTFVLASDGARDGYTCCIFTFLVPGLTCPFPGPKIKLIVNMQTLKVTKPNIHHHADVTARISSTAILECIFSGYDILHPFFPKTIWPDLLKHPQGSTTGKYNVTNGGRRLIIRNVQEKDQMTYICYANNSAGSASSSVYLNVTSGPIFINPPPKETKAALEYDFHIDCQTRSAKGENRPARPIWYINGFQLNRFSGDSRITFSNDLQKLIIKNFSGPADFMCVQCDVSNSVDSHSANTCIAGTVSPIEITRSPPATQMIRCGDIVDLTVTATTDESTKLFFRWKFNGKEIEQNRRPRFVHTSYELFETYIDTMELTRKDYLTIAGVYVIVVYTSYQSVEVATEVVVLDDQEVRDLLPTFQISLVVLAALAIVVLVFITLYKMKMFERHRIERPTPRPSLSLGRPPSPRKRQESIQSISESTVVTESSYETLQS